LILHFQQITYSEYQRIERPLVDGKKYEITDKGVRFLEKKTFERISEDVRRSISNIKETHGKEELNDLLKYVYITYPDFTITSEILYKLPAQ